jgi:type IX secretion system PorP/SprF family membrane protein
MRYLSLCYNFKISKCLLPAILSLIFSQAVEAQLSPIYSKHYIYEQFINPAISGRDLSPVINMSHKQFWIGSKNSPTSTGFGASARLGTFNFYKSRQMLNRSSYKSQGRMGVGALMIAEKDGPLSSYSGTFTYSYFIPIENRNTELSFGLSAQLLYFTVNKSSLTPFDLNDPEFLKLGETKLIPETGFGVYFHTLQFYIGASVNDLLQSKMPLENNSISGKRDYSFQTGYRIFLYRFDMEPSVYLAKINEKPMYYFAQTKFYYKNVNWVGVAYKSTNAFMFSIGFAVRRFSIAYATELGISDIASNYGNMHELMIGINIGIFEPQGLRKRTSKSNN